MKIFYNELNISTKQVVDASANGAILSKTSSEAYEILERIASNKFSMGWCEKKSRKEDPRSTWSWCFDIYLRSISFGD